MKRTLCSLEWLGTGANWTLWQLRLSHASQTLEVIMTRSAEMRGSKTEIDCHRATVTAFVLQKVCAMFWTNLCMQNVHILIDITPDHMKVHMPKTNVTS